MADYVSLDSFERIPLVIFEINVLKGPNELLADDMISLVADTRYYKLTNDHLFGGLNVRLVSKPLLPQIDGLRLSVYEPREMNDLCS